MTSSPDLDVLGYGDAGFTIVRGLVDRVLTDFFTAYMDTLDAAGRLDRDAQVPGAVNAYGDPAFDTLLSLLTSAASDATGHDLVPTYSFVRRYGRGHELVPHRDRPACEHSATVHLAAAPGPSWPIHLRRHGEPAVTVELEPGDALFYRGADLLHWRDRLETDWHLQAFLHWVDAGGPHAQHRFDDRPTLGRPSSERRR